MSRFLIVGFGLVAYLFYPPVAFALKFTEIAYSFPGSDTHHEWVEVMNNEEQPFDLTNWLFFDGSYHGLASPPAKGGQGHLSLPAASYAVLADDAAQFLLDHPGFQGTVIDTIMNLPNYDAHRTEPIKLALTDKTKQQTITASYLPTLRGNAGYTWELQTDDQWGSSRQVGGSPGFAPQPLGLANHLNPQLSEIMANPVGKDEGNEWVELYNPTDQSIDLGGIQFINQPLAGSQNDKLTLPAGSIIEAHQYWLFWPRHGFLRNKAQTLSLEWPDGQTIVKLEIPAAPSEGLSYIFLDGLWQWTAQPSPGQPNHISQTLPSPTLTSTRSTVADRPPRSAPSPVLSTSPLSTSPLSTSPLERPSSTVSPAVAALPSLKSTPRKNHTAKPPSPAIFPTQIVPIATPKVMGKQTVRSWSPTIIIVVGGATVLLAILTIRQRQSIRQLADKIRKSFGQRLIV